MNYQEFRCEFLERMKEVMEEGVNITTEQINKNNGIVMEGLVLRKENARVASVFYLEDYFKYWERGVPMEQLVRKVLWQGQYMGNNKEIQRQQYNRTVTMLKQYRDAQFFIQHVHLYDTAGGARWYFAPGLSCKMPNAA